ncbi:carbonic anhydrase [Noviherbaspirillum sedimenti]|nr:carbonic anhydrase family protein [Noviherbaspirillum sedimenti]
MHIRCLALAGMLLLSSALSSAHAVEQVIQLPRPAAPVRDTAALKKSIAASDDDEENIQQLAERISARLANLRKAKESRPAPPPHRKAAVASAKAGVATVAAGSARHDWHYEGEGGPAQWGSMNPAWGACANGPRQSPIDIRDGFRVDLEPVQFDYKPTRFSVLDNGHTVQVNLGLGNAIIVSGRSYELTQFHFHLPSEERVNGKSYPMVLHLVHKDAAGRYAVVALLVEEGEPHGVVQQVWNNLPLEKHDAAIATSPMALAALLPARREYYTYMGSLTTPPCTEGVLWIVLKEPIRLSSQQIAIFARLYPMNARPIQAQAGRMIKESN